MRLRSYENAMGSCTAQCKMLLFCAKTVMRESGNFELAGLKKEGKKPTLVVSGAVLLRCFSQHWESSWPGKQAYMLTAFEIFERF